MTSIMESKTSESKERERDAVPIHVVVRSRSAVVAGSGGGVCVPPGGSPKPPCPFLETLTRVCACAGWDQTAEREGEGGG